MNVCTIVSDYKSFRLFPRNFVTRHKNALTHDMTDQTDPTKIVCMHLLAVRHKKAQNNLAKIA